MTTVYKYSKDKSITIEKEIVNNKGKEHTKYTATKDGKTAKGFPSEESAISFLNRNFVNAKKVEVINNNNNSKLNLKQMEKSLAQLEKELSTLEKGLTKDEIQENKVLRKSLNDKISWTKQQIKKLKGVEPKVEKAPKVAKPIVEKEPKVAKPTIEKAPKVEKPKVEKEPKVSKPSVSAGDFKEGDSVSFIDKDTDKKTIGKIKSIVKGSSPGSFNAIVITTNGDRKKMRISKIEKV